MALMSLVSKEFKTKIGSLTFDGTLEETITARYEISAYPTESKEEAVNNIARKRRALRLQLIVTDTPNPTEIQSLALSAFSFGASKMPSAVQGAIGMAAQLPITLGDASKTRSAAALQNMLKEADKRERFDVFTEKGLYKNMVISNVYSKNDPDTQRHVIIDIDMEESPVFEIEGEKPDPKKMVDHSPEAYQGASIVDLGRYA